MVQVLEKPRSVGYREKLPRDIAEEADKFRSDTIRAIHTKEPLFITPVEAHGDNMIRWWAYYYALRKLCDDENIDHSGIRLKTKPLESEANQSPTLSDILEKGKLGQKLDRFIDSEHVYTHCLQKATIALDVQITDEDTRKPPQPFKTDSGPLACFDKEKMAREGNLIRSASKKQNNRHRTIGQLRRKTFFQLTNSRHLFLL